MTRRKRQAAVAAWVRARAAAIHGRQTAYHARHGRYWQGLAGSPPKDGAEHVPDTRRHPTDQAEGWAEMRLPARWPCALRVDVYDGPQGQGYTITAAIDHNAKYSRTWNVGPETRRAHGWRKVEAIPLAERV